MFLAAIAVFQTGENGLRNVSWLPFLQALTHVSDKISVLERLCQRPAPKLPPSSQSKELLIVIQVDFTTPIGWLERLQSAAQQSPCC